MLYLILVESGLELIPSLISNEIIIKKSIKKFGNIGKILDISYHRRAMYKLENYYKRGRPDIIHNFMIDTQSSILNHWGLLRTFIHTYQDAIFEVNPLMRPPKDYLRFKGLMFELLTQNVLKTPLEKTIIKNTFYDEKYNFEENQQKISKDKKDYFKPILFARSILEKRKKIKSDGPPFDFLDINHFINNNELILMRRMKMNLRKLISYLNTKYIIKFTSKGNLISHLKIFKEYKLEDDIIAIVGGFQSGYFSNSIKSISGKEISIFPIGLESNIVVNRILINYENFIIENLI